MRFGECEIANTFCSFFIRFYFNTFAIQSETWMEHGEMWQKFCGQWVIDRISSGSISQQITATRKSFDRFCNDPIDFFVEMTDKLVNSLERIARL